jgi:hypothetical protein
MAMRSKVLTRWTAGTARSEESEEKAAVFLEGMQSPPPENPPFHATAQAS